GHPDKIADQISDAILDAILAADPRGRVACETAVTTGLAFVIGEITTSTYVEMRDIIRETIAQAGYDRPGWGFDADTVGVIVSIDKQSPDIAQGVDTGGAGDQGMMFGFACDETPELMPMPIQLAHNLARQMAQVRKQGTLPYLGPDGKTQVTIQYVDGRPVRIDTVVLSAQHTEETNLGQMREDLRETVLDVVVPATMIDRNTTIHVNPTGRFVLGGPRADAGLTGRKIIVDSYGGYARHGGGCFSGKDPSKVDRSGAYAARYVAKHVVAAGLARMCEIQLAYAIGVRKPVSVLIDCFGTERIPVERIEALVTEHFDLSPLGIIKELDLRRPIYRQTAAYGHFGRSDLDLPWERTPKADLLAEEGGVERLRVVGP
ncbi:MAG TPA: methionine adenosyltransferase, partial [Candidatus Limnocylindrales bacterium]|nr:methionine adenosyltransferase [Candidatus Limnocylindrales bacterium]